MQPFVTAILVARNGADYLRRTLDAIAAGDRKPDSLIVVDAGSSDATDTMLALSGAAHHVTTPGSRSFGGGIAHGLQVAAPVASASEWLWLLGHDNAPEPAALASLLGAVEVAPSVAVAGPKLMRWDDPATIASYGETITPFGTSVAIVENELDQAQHDFTNDVLAAAAGGMLVRREVWSALGGFDPGLPTVDAALDFCVRARLAGHRVVRVPSARVATAGGPETFGRKSVLPSTVNRIRRAAQLHRRLVYAPALAVPLHWLSLVPLAIFRSLGHLVGKRPGAVVGELATGVAAAFDARVAPARKSLRRTRKLGWGAIAPLRMSFADARELRADRRAAAAVAATGERTPRPGFFSAGGAWVVLLAAAIGVLAFGPYLGATALSGGGLLPLSSDVGSLWQHTGYGWRDIGAGFVGAADPFAVVLAVLGSLTFWSPSLSVVILTVAAVPLAALAAWFCAARFSQRGWAPGIAALLWSLAPPFLASLTAGHLGAVIAHVLLPWFVLAAITAARSWSGAATAALLLAVIAASAPVLVPALLAGWIVWAFANPRGFFRIIGIPIPAVALFAPLVYQQLQRGNWLALVAEPGLPVAGGTTSGWQLAIGSPAAGVSGWSAFAAAVGLPPASVPVIVFVLLAPLAVLALLSLFLPGSRRAIPSMVLALLGFATAVIAAHIEVTVIGAQTVPVWPAAGLSLYWFGLIGAATAALEAFGKGVTWPALITGLAASLAVVPLLIAPITGTAAVTTSAGRLLPAFVTAETAARPDLGTIEIIAQANGGIATTLHRGAGTTLDEQSTLAATSTTISEAEDRLAILAGNVASRSGFDIAGEFDELQIGFVLVPDAAAGAEETRQRVADALDGNRELTPVGSTAYGYLWHFPTLADGEAPRGPGALDTPLGVGILVAQGIVFGVALLLAVPTTGRRRVRPAAGSDEPVGSFEEDDNA